MRDNARAAFAVISEQLAIGIANLAGRLRIANSGFIKCLGADSIFLVFVLLRDKP